MVCKSQCTLLDCGYWIFIFGESSKFKVATWLLYLLINTFGSVITSRSIVVIMFLPSSCIHLCLLLLLFLIVPIVYLDDPVDYLLLLLLLSLVRSKQLCIGGTIIIFFEKVLTFKYGVHQLGHQALPLILLLVVVRRGHATATTTSSCMLHRRGYQLGHEFRNALYKSISKSLGVGKGHQTRVRRVTIWLCRLLLMCSLSLRVFLFGWETYF